MHKKTSTLSAILLALSTVLFNLQAVAADTDTLVVAPNMYQIDNTKNIILVNQDVQQLNALYTKDKSAITLDKTYAFTDNVHAAVIGQAYQVTSGSSTYSLYFTQLPIIQINTKNTIKDEPRVFATFTMSETSGAFITSNLGIEIRGHFSQTLPKKSYRIEFWEDTAGVTTRDFSLLRMRNDDDWNLQAMYNEPMRVRSKSANELWQEMHQIYYKKDEPQAVNGIKMQYAELFLNHEYKGLYAIGERVDNKQLQLKKYNGSIRGELYKASDWGSATTFTSAPDIDNTSLLWGGFEYEFPDEVVNWKNLHDFVDFASTSTTQDFNAGYKSKFNVENAADNFILLNVLRATDNVGKNVYIAKYKAGEPYFFIPWDLDGVFGTGYMGDEVNTTNDILSNNFYNRLLQDYSEGGFRETLKRRWTELRASVVTQQNIMAKITANQQYLAQNGVYTREQLAWPDFSYNSSQLTYTATWVANRLEYLDGYFSQSYTLLATKQAKAAVSFKAYPNPAHDFLYLDLDSRLSTCQVSIKSLSGKVVLQQAMNSASSKVAIQDLPAGVYFITVQNDKFIGTQKLLID